MPVRSLVGIITTIATVIHFTFGCCLHPCPIAGRGECATHAVGGAACEECCHEHDALGAGHEAVGFRFGTAEVGTSTPSTCDPCHGCEGCHCAATSTKTGAAASWSSPASVVSHAIDGTAVRPFAGADGNRPPDPHPSPRPDRHPLFERSLI